MSHIFYNKLRISRDGYNQHLRLIKDFPVTRLSRLHLLLSLDSALCLIKKLLKMTAGLVELYSNQVLQYQSEVVLLDTRIDYQ